MADFQVRVFQKSSQRYGWFSITYIKFSIFLFQKSSQGINIVSFANSENLSNIAWILHVTITWKTHITHMGFTTFENLKSIVYLSCYYEYMIFFGMFWKDQIYLFIFYALKKLHVYEFDLVCMFKWLKGCENMWLFFIINWHKCITLSGTKKAKRS